MPKLQKAPPLAYSGLNIVLPKSPRVATRYEDLPASLPDQAPVMATGPLSMSSKNPYLQLSQEQRPPLLHYVDRPRRMSAGQATAGDSKKPYLISPITPQSTAPQQNTPWTPPKPQYTNRNRSSSAPPTKSRRTSPPIAQDGHSSMRLPQYKPEQTQKSCPANCKKCGRRQPEPLDALRQAGTQSFPADSIPVTSVERPQPHSPGSCGSDCKKCGKQRSVARTGAPGTGNLTNPPAAYTRSASESAVRHTPASPPMPVIASSSFSGPMDILHRHHQCGKCGKPKRPASMPNPKPALSRGSDFNNWPLTSTAPARPTPPIPIIVGGFENRSTATLIGSPFLANGEDSPLIAKKPAAFNAVRNTSTRASYTRKPLATNSRSGASSLIRRLSSRLRPSTEAAMTKPSITITPAPKTTPNQQTPYLSIPASDEPPRPASSPRPFSFIDAASDGDFEMTDIRLDDTPTLTTSSSASSTPPKLRYDMDDLESTSSAYDEDEARDTIGDGLARDNSVMRRAVTGSIRRFKSLKGAHRILYQDSIAIEGVGYRYGYEEKMGVAVGAY